MPGRYHGNAQHKSLLSCTALIEFTDNDNNLLKFPRQIQTCSVSARTVYHSAADAGDTGKKYRQFEASFIVILL